MSIVNQGVWEEYVEGNKDPYGKACVDVARKVMELLDEDVDFVLPNIVNWADDEIGTGGLTGFMAGAVAAMVSQCHSRGEEFRLAWNRATQLRDEGERANEIGDILNPALLMMD